MGVAEEDISNHVWRVSVDNLVEEVCRIGDRVGAVPSTQDVTHDPDALTGILCFLEFLD